MAGHYDEDKNAMKRIYDVSDVPKGLRSSDRPRDDVSDPRDPHDHHELHANPPKRGSATKNKKKSPISKLGFFELKQMTDVREKNICNVTGVTVICLRIDKIIN